MKETYLSRDFRETAAQCFPSQAKELNAFFDARLSVLLAENADASKEKQYHLKRQILPGIPMYVPMLLVFGIHFVMLLAGKTRYPRWILAFHPVTWNILLVAVPDIAQAMQVPTATWMSVMSQSSTNTATVIWCIAAAVYEKKRIQE
ncbi:hypothetical protein [uncultured Merdimonas sp.]|uniref:hypothetical protein n=1 Tax=uncultured Merdimonas sp. TaxID=2023269 RepID=UPI00320B88C6